MSHLLSGLILLPLAGALAILFVPGEGEAARRSAAGSAGERDLGDGLRA